MPDAGGVFPGPGRADDVLDLTGRCIVDSLLKNGRGSTQGEHHVTKDSGDVADRAPPGDARLHRAAGAPMGPVPRLRPRAVDSRPIAQRVTGRNGLALSRASAPRSATGHRHGVGRVRQQSAGAYVSPDTKGTRAPLCRAVAMGAAVGSDRLTHAATGSRGGAMSVRDWLPWVRDRRTSELADEMRTHLEMAIADRLARGESPTAAAANARREFGNAGLVQEIARDEWGGGARAFETLGRDVRFALRMFRRAPGFSAVAILTIALGIGATTAIYSIVDATLVHPLPYPQADALVRIEDDLVGVGARNVGMSTPEWHDLQSSGVFDYVSPTWFDNNNLTGLRRAQRVSIQIVATNYFALLGVKPQLGAGFDPTDRTPGFNGQVVISDALWKGAFGADPMILGRVVQLDSDSYRIVGVMHAGFQAPARTAEERATEVWPAFGFAGAPLSERNVQSRNPLFQGAVARLAQGLTIGEAQRRIDGLVRSLRRQFPEAYPPRIDWRVQLVPLKETVV